jgi:hypothetical protein
VISGLWHGAAWHFVVWGLLHGVFQVAERGLGGFRRRAGIFAGLRGGGALAKCLQGGWVFLLVSFAWIFFRANSLGEAFLIIGRLTGLPAELAGYVRELPVRGLIGTARLAFQLGSPGQGGITAPIPNFGLMNAGLSLLLVGVLVAGDWLRRTGAFGRLRLPLAPRWALYYSLLFAVLLSWDAGSSAFIYFTF